MIPSSEMIGEARRELLRKPKVEIEEETATKWAARAIAAYLLFEETQDPSFLFDAVEYQHEAIEHASDTPILGELITAMADARLRIVGLV